MQIDSRFGEGDAEHYRRFASELVALRPCTVPIVFVTVTDPVGGGLVATRPASRFPNTNICVSGKWPDLRPA
jgi:hypothetical protein